MNLKAVFSSRIRNRIISCFAVTMIAVILVFDFFLINVIRNITTEYIVNSNERILNYAKRELESEIENVNSIINSLLQNQYLQDILRKNIDEYPMKEQLEDYAYLEDVLYNIDLLTDFADSFYFFVNPGFYYSGEKFHIYPLSDILFGIDSTSVLEEKGATVWNLYDGADRLVGYDEPVLAGARALVNMNDFTDFPAVIYFTIPLSNISDILDLASYEGNSIYLMRGEEIIAANEEIPAHSAEYVVSCVSSKDDENMVQVKEIVGTPFSLVSIIDAGKIGTAVFNYRVSTIALGVLMFAVSIAVSFTVTKVIVKRLREIENNISYSYENSFTGIPVLKDDEFSFFEDYYNDLASRINALIESTLEQGKALQRSQYIALKAQINPHFLYNALNTINMMAVKYNAADITAMISNLALFYRLSLNNGCEMASVSDEIRLCEVYLKIQQQRFSFPLHLEVVYENELLEKRRIVNLILQPLVENAVLHGIIGRNIKEGIISVTVKEIDSNLLIEVEDNGIGCQTDFLNASVQNASFRSEHGSGYGLRNIHMRLRLYYGQNSGLVFSQSEKYGGLKVTVKF